jgi:hypothetical protein
MHRLRKQPDQQAYAGTPCAAEMHTSETRQMQSQIGAIAAVNQCWRRMKHPSIRRLFDYWSERRGARLVPRREDIVPEAMRCVLGDRFSLSFAPTVGHPVRVAGTHVCAFFGREIKGEGFLVVFSSDARGEVSNLITVIADESVGVVGSASEQFSDAQMLRFEFLLLPLSLHGAGIARLLGALVPADPPAWPSTRGLANLALGSYRFIGGLCSAGLVPGRLLERRGDRPFVVYEGGQR